VVVTVDPAGRQITIKPWGVRGPLTWSDLDRSKDGLPAAMVPDGPVEWVVR
jgi:hypothetical protein